MSNNDIWRVSMLSKVACPESTRRLNRLRKHYKCKESTVPRKLIFEVPSPDEAYPYAVVGVIIDKIRAASDIITLDVREDWWKFYYRSGFEEFEKEHSKRKPIVFACEIYFPRNNNVLRFDMYIVNLKNKSTIQLANLMFPELVDHVRQ